MLSILIILATGIFPCAIVVYILFREKPATEEIQQELEKEEALKQQYANMTDEQLIQIGVKKDEKWETEKAARKVNEDNTPSGFKSAYNLNSFSWHRDQ